MFYSSVSLHLLINVPLNESLYDIVLSLYVKQATRESLEGYVRWPKCRPIDMWNITPALFWGNSIREHPLRTTLKNDIFDPPALCPFLSLLVRPPPPPKKTSHNI